MNVFAGLTKKAVETSLLETKWQADQERQEEAQNRLDLYRDDYEEIIKDKIKDLFCTENYDRLKYHVNQSQNILKRVVREISTIYKAPAKRGLDIESDRYAEIVDDLDMETKGKKINRLTNLLNEVIVKVGVRNNKIVYDFITPNICSVIQNEDDPTKADAFLWMTTLVNTTNSPTINYYYMDNLGFYQRMDERFRVIKEFYNPKTCPYRNENNEPVMPLVVVHREEPDDAFWDQDSCRDLYNASVLLGVKFTLFDYYFKVASHKQLYTIGSKVNIPNDQILDPLTMINIVVDPQTQGEVGVLDLQNRMNELRDALIFQINTVINNYGISADMWSLSIQEMSGRALKIRNMALLESRQEQQPFYTKAEKELFDVTRTVNNAHVNYYGWQKIPEEAAFSVDFGEIEFPEDPNYEIDLEVKRLEKGLISLGQFYMKFNPDITDDKQAEKMIIDNLEKFAALREEHPVLDEMLNSMNVQSLAKANAAKGGFGGGGNQP